MSLQREVLQRKLPPLAPAADGSSNSSSSSSSSSGSKIRYKITPWKHYFDEKLLVSPYINGGKDVFCVYKAGKESELPRDAPVLILLHGAGLSSLTWAVTAGLLKKHCLVFAIDFRGHGNSIAEGPSNLSSEQLVDDVVAIVQSLLTSGSKPADGNTTTIINNNNNSSNDNGDNSGDNNNLRNRKLVLVGHSLGGTVAVRCSYKLKTAGLVVLDVVEGTAMAALGVMSSFLSNRPQRFKSVSHAIEWALSKNQVRNPVSACVSVFGHVVPLTATSNDTINNSSLSNNNNNINNDNDDYIDNNPVKWRTDLSETEPFWSGWFKNLSNEFIAAPAAKVLMLAGTDRLDKELTIAQMQGKFQLMLLYNCGHSIQEDDPNECAKTILQFLQRNLLITTFTGNIQSTNNSNNAFIPNASCISNVNVSHSGLHSLASKNNTIINNNNNSNNNGNNNLTSNTINEELNNAAMKL